jgi:DNA invertase Pin-like site-specific DNA recombinase
MKVGYVRVAAADPDVSTRIGVFQATGCSHIFTDKADIPGQDLPGLEDALGCMKAGDVLVLLQLSHLGRSLSAHLKIVNRLRQGGYALQSLQEGIDTTAPYGETLFHLYASLAAFEKSVLRERTMVGLAAARARGRKGGRPKGLSASAQRTAIRAEGLYVAGELSVRQICQELSISRGTFYNYLRARGVKVGLPDK